LLVTEEYNFDLGSGFMGKSQTILHTWSVTGVFQVKLSWANGNYIVSGWLILLCQTELHVAFYFHSILVTTNGDQWKETETYVFDMTYVLSLQASTPQHPHSQSHSFTPEYQHVPNFGGAQCLQLHAIEFWLLFLDYIMLKMESLHFSGMSVNYSLVGMAYHLRRLEPP
jgi:hypothetical protein